MSKYSQKRTIIGFLENLSFNDVDNFAKKHGVDPRLIRRDMLETFEELFESRGVPYIGPSVDTQHPLGGYIFKMNPPREEKIYANLH